MSARMSCGLATRSACAVLACGVALAIGADGVRAATPEERLTQVEGELAGERFGNAVIVCEESQKEGALTLELRAACARAYIGLGDKLLAAGSPENARKRWDEAAAIDPRVMDDPDFVKRLTSGRVPSKDPQTPPDGATPADPNKPADPTDPSKAATEARPKPLPKKPLPLPDEREGPPPNAGPRWDRGLGLGLSFGHDGLAALQLGWLTDETILVEVTFGIVYPTADIRVRWLGMRECVTPFLGAGLLVPFGETDRLGLAVGGYESLYELGEAFHLDLGIAYTPVHRLDLYAGVAFMTPMDQDHPDTVLFFPQLTAGASWFF